ncbi:zinc finger protein 394-like isoform X2 [Gadus chalcogrammus]|uniref:zinc finger protein 394-like isoform X2 n=1 Tax=Gadus chalcogrammus TaxID=1042646 RepID=UPI0024C2E4CD|nr:zinc finger protein 394-like isoform X2 [Gadus chalcogrammus]
MLINMSPCNSTMEDELSSIMDALAKAAVSEITKLFSEGSATLRLQITRSLKEKEAMKTRMKVMRRELFSLRLQTRSNASRAASRLALARANICRPWTKPLGNEDFEDFGDHSTQRGAISESLHAPGSSHMSSHSEELRILGINGEGEGSLAVDGRDALFTASEVEALSPLSADHSVTKSLERGERLVCREELTVQQTPDTILIKDEEDIGGAMPALEDCDDFEDRSTKRGATSDSLHVDAPGSSHMSSHSEELWILSVAGKGEGPLAVDGHDTLFTASDLEARNSLPADHSVAKSLERGEWLVHLEELTEHRSGRKGRPCVLFGKGFPDNTKKTIPMITHTGEKPYGCYQCTKRFQKKANLKAHMRTHSLQVKPYRCDQCMKSFVTSAHLKAHMRTHSGEKPYSCDQCMRRFGRSSDLKRHMSTHSLQVKPYRCDQCMKSFVTSSHLKVHLRIHSGEKPYRCNQCMKSFIVGSQLKSHIRTHTGEKPFVCLQCNASFGDRSTLARHMRKHKGNEVL